MKKLLLFVIAMFVATTTFAQVEEVTITTIGTGTTEEEATLQALRSAIEQTFGTFVSSNTSILNDNLVKDEIVSISKGNVKEYQKLAVLDLGNGSFSVSVKATISINKLISYAKSKGSAVEFEGQSYFANLKLLKLKASATEKAYAIMVKQLTEMAKDMFDFELTIGEPTRVTIDGEDRYMFLGVVDVLSNATSTNFFNLYASTIKELCITKEEFELCLRENSLDMVSSTDVYWEDINWRTKNNVPTMEDLEGWLKPYDLGCEIFDMDSDDINSYKRLKFLNGTIDEIGYFNPICVLKEVEANNFKFTCHDNVDRLFEESFDGKKNFYLLIPENKLIQYDAVIRSAIELALIRYRVVEIGNVNNYYQYHYTLGLFDESAYSWRGWDDKKININFTHSLYSNLFQEFRGYYNDWTSRGQDRDLYDPYSLNFTHKSSFISRFASQEIKIPKTLTPKEEWAQMRGKYKGPTHEIAYESRIVTSQRIYIGIKASDMEQFKGFEVQTDGFKKYTEGWCKALTPLLTEKEIIKINDNEMIIKNKKNNEVVKKIVREKIPNGWRFTSTKF